MKILLGAVLLALTAPAMAATNIVTNGSFESGGFAPGWSQFGDTSFTGVDTIFYAAPTDGSFQAYFGPTGGFGGITQNLTGSAGNYTVSFDIGNVGGYGNYVDFGGATILSNVADNAGAWAHYSFTVAAGANPTLTFGFLNPPAYYVLDNVVVSGSVPEPTSWVMLIAGFGLVGAAMRRRTAALAA